MSMWTQFMDMHSGGRQKLKWAYIYIEAEEEKAKVIFYNRFGRSPDRVTCTCCGNDYSISSNKSLDQLTGYERGCRNLKTTEYKTGKKKGLYKQTDDPYFNEHYYLEDGEEPQHGYIVDDRFSRGKTYQTLDEYKKRKDILVVPIDKIRKSEYIGTVPEEGYVWR